MTTTAPTVDRRKAEWLAAINALLLSEYAITFDQAGAGDDEFDRWYQQHLDTGETPAELVKWYAEKYDFTHVNDW